MKALFHMTLGDRLSGAENVLWTYLRHADHDRVEPVFVGVRGALARDVAELGVRTYALPGGRLREAPRTAANVVRFARILRAERPDVIVNWLTKAQLYGGPASALAGLGARNMWWQHDFPNGRLGDRIATLLPTRAIVACSSAVADEQARLRPRRRCLFVLAGIEEPRRAPDAELDELRAQLSLPPRVPIAGMLGRLIPWKGQHHFIGALAQLREAGVPVHGLIVGGDAYGMAPEYARELRDLTARLGLESHVTFTGHVREPARHLQLMDVAVNASAREPFGVVLLEAMALGVPVVAVDAAGPREIVEPGRSGMLASSADPAELRRAIDPVLGNDDLARRLSAGGRARFESRFTARRMATEIQSRLADVAAAPEQR